MDDAKKKAIARIQLDRWATDFCEPLAVETLKLLASRGDRDDQAYLAMIGAYVREVIKWVVYRELTSSTKHLRSDKEKYEFLKNRFISLKACLQDAIADGFSLGSGMWNNKELEYYCVVKLVPEAAAPATGGSGGGKDKTFH